MAEEETSETEEPQALQPESSEEQLVPTQPEPVARPVVEGEPARTAPPNNVFIGKKPLMTYAMSAMIQLAQSGEIVLKARGMVISRAVDVAEIVTKRLGNNAFSVKDIKIDTERLGMGEESRNVSTIEIIIGRK